MDTSNEKWRALLQVILFSGFASLAGCGKDDNGNGNSSGFSNPTSPVAIQSYNIAGNQPLLMGSLVPQIDSADPDPFLVNWTITGNNVYTAHVFVSANATLEVSDDLEILVGCGKATPTSACSTSSVTYSCSFSSPRSTPTAPTDPTVVCANPVTGGSFATVNLSSLSSPNWMLGSPAYIILQTCNVVSGPCPTASPLLAIRVNFY